MKEAASIHLAEQPLDDLSEIGRILRDDPPRLKRDGLSSLRWAVCLARSYATVAKRAVRTLR